MILRLCAGSLLPVLFFISLSLSASPLPPGIQSGDLIFRDGGEAISDIVRTVDNSGFSHVGMLDITPDGVYVIHATPQEHPGGISGVNRDTLDFFILHAKNGQVSYYAVQADDTHHRLARDNALSQTGIPFSINPQEGLYCTQLVAQAWQSAGLTIINGKTRLSLPMVEEPLILPENLTRSPLLRHIP
ncbi:YiiX/YebB-like N1pC/P60 family cysteine hydrolase [Morganella psychrotolerans]|uniref:Permuted papain-like amidase enzyme, YaeF/YiiX, C92 family n=1 Tax=Morganella psychrotolerans TaxID=368603 RepID=A0A1B8HB93_9GAMM|nr:YiiX/YebB-like N1pC/P60 family cysteine hydrolase [Morganella psychrotolerans]OBU06335.1 hypothetical protein AYY18_07605 [Morganella psychrotolerans]